MGLGEIEEIDGPAGSTATYSVTEVLLSEASAVMVIPLAGIFAGAVYRPPVVILPYVVLPPLTPFTSQVTVVFASPVTTAVYWTVPFTPTVVYPGLIVMVCAVSAAGASIAATHKSSPILLCFVCILKCSPPNQKVIVKRAGSFDDNGLTDPF